MAGKKKRMKMGAVGTNEGKKMAYLDQKYMDELDLDAGDLVSIATGKTKSDKITARVLPYEEETSLDDYIHLSSNIYKTLGGAPGRNVEVDVEPLEYEPATEIIFRESTGRKVDSDYYKKDLESLLTDNPFQLKESVKINDVGYGYHFEVIDYKPRKEAVMVNKNTKIKFKARNPDVEDVYYSDIGGLEKQIEKVRELIELPLTNPEAFEMMGIDAPSGVLLYGPPGTGKTLIGKAIANESDANFYTLDGGSIHGSLYGQSEERIKEAFENARKNAPSILYIDELDAMAPKRSDLSGGQQVEQRVVSTLLSQMDGIKGDGRVIVIASTNRPDTIDEALRRPGRFDREVEVPIPNKDGRKEILEIKTRNMPLSGDVDLVDIAKRTHGYSGADLQGLCTEVAMNTLRKYSKDIMENGTDILIGKKIAMDDFHAAMEEIHPSGLREVYAEIPDVRWDDVGGLYKAKQELEEAVEWPLKFPNLLKKAGQRQTKGILLEGPPGTGKTLLAKAIANKSDTNFISIKDSDIKSKWVGESAGNLKEIFKKARTYSPCILFFDEIESIAPDRSMQQNDSGVSNDIVAQFLSEMDGVEGLKDVVVVAATNRPDMVDKALLRPGRFDKMIHIGEPGLDERLEIYKIHTRKMPLGEGIDLENYAKFPDYTGADIEAICKQAADFALHDFVEEKGEEAADKQFDEFKVEKEYFDKAIKAVQPSSTRGKKKKVKNNQLG